MRRIVSSRWFAVASVAALTVGILVLAACAATLDKSGPGLALGTAAGDLAEAGTILAQKGVETGNPFSTFLGWGLTALGTLGASLFGGAKLADRKIAKYDDKPFTAEDAASIEAAKPKA